MSVGKTEGLCDWWFYLLHLLHGFVPDCNNKQMWSG